MKLAKEFHAGDCQPSVLRVEITKKELGLASILGAGCPADFIEFSIQSTCKIRSKFYKEGQRPIHCISNLAFKWFY